MEEKISDRQPLGALISALGLVGVTFDPRMQICTLEVLLLIARYYSHKDGITVSDLIKLTGLSVATVSRNVAYWEKGHKYMPHAGYELVQFKSHPKDKRKKLIILTKKGENFVKSLLDTMEAAHGKTAR